MVIQDIDFTQGGDTIGKSECTISFRQLTFADTLFTKSKKTSKLRQNQLSSLDKKGKDNGVKWLTTKDQYNKIKGNG